MLVMTLLVRDEEDILDWNFRYHLSRGIDHFLVTDNRSVDGTADIVRRYEREGVARYFHEAADDYSQDLWVTRMVEVAQAELRPDWILHCDADEFWWPDGCIDLPEAFAAVDRDVRAVRVERHNFMGIAGEEDDRPFFRKLVYRALSSTNALGETLPPKVAHRPLRRPHVFQGNHAVSDDGRSVPTEPLGGVSILHFPARTQDQLRNKIEKGGAAYERNARFGQEVGNTWRRMYRACREGEFEDVAAAHFLGRDDLDDRSRWVLDHRLRDYLSRL